MLVEPTLDNEYNSLVSIPAQLQRRTSSALQGPVQLVLLGPRVHNVLLGPIQHVLLGPRVHYVLLGPVQDVLGPIGNVLGPVGNVLLATVVFGRSGPVSAGTVQRTGRGVQRPGRGVLGTGRGVVRPGRGVQSTGGCVLNSGRDAGRGVEGGNRLQGLVGVFLNILGSGRC